jgi:hypothetical protein
MASTLPLEEVEAIVIPPACGSTFGFEPVSSLERRDAVELGPVDYSPLSGT